MKARCHLCVVMTLVGRNYNGEHDAKETIRKGMPNDEETNLTIT